MYIDLNGANFPPSYPIFEAVYTTQMLMKFNTKCSGWEQMDIILNELKFNQTKWLTHSAGFA